MLLCISLIVAHHDRPPFSDRPSLTGHCGHGWKEFRIRAQLKHETLEAWIEEEWLIPSKVGDETMFSDADLARAQLIQDLKDDLGVNDEGVGVILNLVDRYMACEGR